MTPPPELDLPFDSSAPQLEPRIDSRRYLEFIEFNMKVLRQNGQLEKMLAAKPPPVDKMFRMD
jgi:hypothetical protein